MGANNHDASGANNNTTKQKKKKHTITFLMNLKNEHSGSDKHGCFPVPD